MASTPTRNRGARRGGSTAQSGASPQIRKAIAAMRASKQAQQKESSQGTSIETDNPFNQPTHPRDTEDEAAVSLGMASLASLISKAQTSGKLVLSGRSLSTFPDSVCSALLPPNSPFHPGNQLQSSSSSRQPKTAILDMASSSDSWLEARPLTSLKANANEFTQLPEAIGGFDELTALDMHSNMLTSLPGSLMSLVSLTTLNLANNKLTEVPIQLLALDTLISLDLAHNQIKQLWPQGASWKARLEDLQRRCRDSQRASLADTSLDTISTESELSTDFWSTFPSSPAARNRGQSQLEASSLSAETDAPFPRLRSLNLSHNQLTRAAVQSDSCAALPSTLHTLDISYNPLGSSTPLILDQEPFAALTTLQTFALSNCELTAISTGDSILFPQMRELDLSGNLLDALDELPLKLGRQGQRPVKITGLPTGLSSMASKFHDGKGPEVMLRLAGNHLGEEVIRWRSRRRGPASTPATPSRLSGPNQRSKSSETTHAKTAADQLDERMTNLNIAEPELQEETPPNPTTDPKTDATNTDSTGFPYLDHYDAKAQILRCSNRQLQVFESPDSPSEMDLPISAVELHRNQLKEAPFDSFEAWGWANSLTKVDLSRNRISFLKAPHSPFSKLETLNLSSNAIADPGIFHLLNTAAPALLHLELTFNFIATLQGLDELLLRKGGGIKTLRLGGNRISDLSPLVAVAERLREVDPQSLGWQCSEMELHDNDIGKLLPQLGFLPLDILSVSGNIFKIPQHRIWESGGTKGLLKWLRDRA